MNGWTTLETGGTSYAMVDVRGLLADDLDRLPYVLRLLAENCWRHQDAGAAEASVDALRAWGRGGEASIDVMPDRLLMHDTTSTPALVDLAAMRDVVARRGGDPASLVPVLPIEVSVDHSLAVEAYARPDAVAVNQALELRRNEERFAFLKWASGAMKGVSINPPGTGIMHTLNLEQFATVSTVLPGPDGVDAPVVAPDFMLGTDSHTPMVNGLGVLGWGIGGLEAELIMLGIPTSLRLPDVVGVRLSGALTAGASATDLALVVTERLRRLGVAGRFVEFFGPGVSTLSVGERGVVANMAPEYGATTGFFPVDAAVGRYLTATGRPAEHVALVEAHARAAGLWRTDADEPEYSEVLEIDLGSLRRSASGPQRPQDRLDLADVPSSLPVGEPGAPAGADGVPAFPVALASITSCTNTTDPRQLVTAGLLARRAREWGLTAKPWVKTSLAPGSPAAVRYLERAGLQEDLDALGFDIVGFGCATCIGNSGPLPEPIATLAARGDVRPVAILSGNRNFPGRVNPSLDLAFLMAPPLVVAYAIVGDATADVADGVLGTTADGREIRLADLWPDPAEVDAALASGLRAEDFGEAFAQARASESWAGLEAATGALYPWDEASTILQPPEFVTGDTSCLLGRYTATPLLVLGDDVTTDHISPASAIPRDSFVADYLVERGEDRGDLNVFASRRGNWKVMMRGAFFNKNLRNALGAGVEGGLPTGYTVVAGSHEVLPIFEVAARYRGEGRSAIVVAGERYGMGSSRDWAAKAQRLLDIRAVLAASFERIHRSNLVGMGILPLVVTGDDLALVQSLGVDDTVEIDATAIAPEASVPVVAVIGGVRHEIAARAAVETEAEVALLEAGGAVPFILDRTERAAAVPASGAGASEVIEQGNHDGNDG